MNPILLILIILISLLSLCFIVLVAGISFCCFTFFFIKALFLGVRQDDNHTMHFFKCEDFDNLVCEQEKFKSEKYNLQGYFYHNKTIKQNAIIVLSHGFGPGQQQYMAEIDMLCKNGFYVFSYDVRGCDKSEGKGIKSFKNAIIDLESAINFVNNKQLNLPIMLYGHSMGGYSVNNVLPQVPFVKGAVSISSPNSFTDLIANMVKVNKFKSFFLFFFNFFENIQGGKYKNTTSVKALKNTSVPILMIHGEKDYMVSLETHSMYQEELKEDCNKKFMIVHNRYHRPIMSESGAEYNEEVQLKIQEANKKYKNKLNEKVKRELYDSFDYQKLVEMDQKIIKQIIDFYYSCIN